MRFVTSVVVALVLGTSLSSAAQEKMDDGPKVAKARWCDGCKAFIAPRDLVDKHRCPSCKTLARRVEIEEVRLFVCPDCGRRTECPRECCGAPVKSSAVRAAVIWRCVTCGAFDTSDGPCPSPGCRKAGRVLERTVELPNEKPPEKK